MNLEKTNSLEQGSKINQEIPGNHLEKCENKSALENMSLSEASKEIGKEVYAKSVLPFNGLRGAFDKLSDTKGAEEFSEKYSEYVSAPEKLKEADPKMYEFMKDRIFGGREYETEEVTNENSDNPSFGSIGPNVPCPGHLDIIAHNKDVSSVHSYGWI